MEYFNEEQKLLLMEGSLTLSTLTEGLDCLRKANMYEKGLYYQAFLSLSIGIERLLKIILLYEYRINNDGKFPENNYLKEKGHDLYEMFKIVSPNTLEDNVDNLVIKFLSNFAKSTRYYNLDVLTRRDVKLLNPLEECKNIEDIIIEKYNVKQRKIQNQNPFVNHMNEISSILYLDMRGREINDFNDVLNECEMRDIIQGYNVLVFYKIIKSLMYTLTEYEIRNNLFPCLREFFSYFRGNFTDSEIRKKKSWRNVM